MNQNIPDDPRDDELFAVPATRPAPAHLRERILDEVAAEPDERRSRRTWLAPVVAAGLVVAVGGSALWLHGANRPAPADSPSPQPSTRSSHSDAAWVPSASLLHGDQLLQACASWWPTRRGMAPWTSTSTGRCSARRATRW